MSTPTQSPEEQAARIIARWRRIFLGLYLAFVVGAILVTFSSVVSVHAGVYRVPIAGKRIGPKADDPKELRDCIKRLDRLLTDLHKETFTLLARAQRFEIDPLAEWSNWSRDWQHQWKALDYRCRLSELSGQASSPEIDKMANIHAALDELHISYTGVVNTFADRYVDRLRKLKKEVDEVRAMIDRRRRSRKPGVSQ